MSTRKERNAEVAREALLRGGLAPAARLRAARRALGLTLSGLAAELETSDPAISDWENTHKRPDADNREKVRDWTRRAASRLAIEERLVLIEPVEWKAQPTTVAVAP